MMDHIGKITGIHGLKGEVTFNHQLKHGTKFAQWDCLFVELNPGSFIPFFIESMNSISDEECICKLEEINNRDEAKLVVNRPIYSSINFTVESVAVSTLQQYVGFMIIHEGEEIGKITDAIESTMNSMFVVDHQGKEVMLPSQKELIKKIEQKERRIHMIIPDGLLDL